MVIVQLADVARINHRNHNSIKPDKEAMEVN